MKTTTTKLTREEKKAQQAEEARLAQQARNADSAKRMHKLLVGLQVVEEQQDLSPLACSLDWQVREVLRLREDAATEWQRLANSAAETAQSLAAGRLNVWHDRIRHDAEVALAKAQLSAETTSKLLAAFGWLSARLDPGYMARVVAARRLSVKDDALLLDGEFAWMYESDGAAWLGLKTWLDGLSNDPQWRPGTAEAE